MSGDHSSGNLKCDCNDEDCDNDHLWTDFESCAQSVTRLYREPSWKTLQVAATSTTQMYKSAVDIHRRGFERGFQAGRTGLAKEVLAAFSAGAKFDVNVLLDILCSNIKMTSDDNQMGQSHTSVTGDTIAAVHLFQQALAQQSNDLNNFLSSQVQRNRKRPRSPPSPSSLMKRLRRT